VWHALSREAKVVATPSGPSTPFASVLKTCHPTDFDPLRGRDDFQKLLAELEAKAGPKAKPKD
jgi:hypothetical protein